jgi:UDP-2,3-diacylglucosamine pyrophosphatase LpxH
LVIHGDTAITDIRTYYALKYPSALFVHPSSHLSIFMTSVT